VRSVPAVAADKADPAFRLELFDYAIGEREGQ
jgi:hypothetical protein